MNIDMDTNRRLVYSGEKFRDFLAANHITYQEASNVLGIDKNTIGKAVRGGNLNTSILLKICNEYKLDLNDFFVAEDGSEIASEKGAGTYCGQDNAALPDEGAWCAAEKEEPYASGSGIAPGVMEELLRSKEKEIARLRMLVKLYQERADMLQQKLVRGLKE